MDRLSLPKCFQWADSNYRFFHVTRGVFIKLTEKYIFCDARECKANTSLHNFFTVAELTGWVADALRLIAVSRNGLGQAEILGILEQLGYQGTSRVTSFDWALFRSAALDALFERPGGLLTFFHQHFKEAVEHTLLGERGFLCPSQKVNGSRFIYPERKRFFFL